MSAIRRRRAMRSAGTTPAPASPTAAPAAVPTAPRRSGIELLVGIAAVLLSLCALVVSVVQTRIAEAQKGAAVWPHLQVEDSHLDADFTLAVLNNGVGPAVVDSVSLHYGDQTYAQGRDLYDAEVRRFGAADSSVAVGTFFSSLNVGDVVQAGESAGLVSTLRGRAVADRLSEVVRDSSFHLRVRYRDVYGTCWQLDNADVTESDACRD